MRAFIILVLAFASSTAVGQDHSDLKSQYHNFPMSGTTGGWVKSMSGNQYALGIALDSSGNVYVTGSFRGTTTVDTFTITTTGRYGIFLAKYDRDGHLDWVKSATGNNDDEAQKIATDASGNVYIVGSFQDTINFDNIKLITEDGADEYYIAKYHQDGAVEWVKSIGQNGSGGYGLSIDQNSNIYITGSFEHTAQIGNFKLVDEQGIDGDIFIAKLHSDGSVVWAKRAGGKRTDAGHAIVVDPFGNINTTGYFEDTAYFDSSRVITNYSDSERANQFYIAKYQSNGDLIYANVMDKNPSVGVGIANDGLGNTYVIGGSQNIFIAKYNSQGTIEWRKEIEGNHIGISNIVLDALSNLYFTGFFSDTATFGNIGLSGIEDNLFIAKYQPDGNVEWVKKPDGVNRCYGTDIALDNFGNIYITGYYQGQLVLDRDTLRSDFASMFVWKIGSNTSAVQRNSYNSSFSLNPNPTNNTIHINIETIESGKTQLTLLNLLGARVATIWDAELAIGTHSFDLNTNTLSEGSYFLMLQTPTMRKLEKLIIEK